MVEYSVNGPQRDALMRYTPVTDKLRINIVGLYTEITCFSSFNYRK